MTTMDVEDTAWWIVLNCDGRPDVPLDPKYEDMFDRLRQDKSGRSVVIEAQRLLALTERRHSVIKGGKTKQIRREYRANYAKLFVSIGRRDGFSCYVCGSSPRDLQIDHYLPIVMGGTNDLDNLRLCCPLHNIEKGTDVPMDIEI